MIYFFIGMVIIIVAFCFSTLELEVKIAINNKTNDSFFIIRLFGGLLRLRFNFTLSWLGKGVISLIFRKTDSDLEHKVTIEEVFHFIVNQYNANIKYIDEYSFLASKTTIQNLGVDMKIGLADAAQTALISGSIITIFSLLKGYLIKKFRLKSGQIKLLPYFNDIIFDMELDCIIHVKLGHIIITGIRMLLHSIKGGEISGRTPY